MTQLSPAGVPTEKGQTDGGTDGALRFAAERVLRYASPKPHPAPAAPGEFSEVSQGDGGTQSWGGEVPIVPTQSSNLGTLWAQGIRHTHL